jgi:hypothetical protein
MDGRPTFLKSELILDSANSGAVRKSREPGKRLMKAKSSPVSESVTSPAHSVFILAATGAISAGK